MLNDKNGLKRIKLYLMALFIGISGSVGVMAQENVKLSDAEVKNIVERSYQYVAMYNVIQKFATNPDTGDLYMDGYNKTVAATRLADHTMRVIARPNNDTFYQGLVMDLRNDAIIVEYPVIDSKFVVLQTSGYDHYTDVPLSTSTGDFKKPTRVLFYSDRTKGYQGEPVEGVDRIIKEDGDIVVAFLRAMPHQADKTRMAKVIQSLNDVKAQPLSSYKGKPSIDSTFDAFPTYGKSDADVFENNLLQVMQFIFNQNSFDMNNAMDVAVLAAFKPLGVEPGKKFDASKVVQIDGARFKKVSQKIAADVLVAQSDPKLMTRLQPQLFMPKGKIDLETQILQSVVGPIGLPAYQAIYMPLATKDGAPMNTKHDYVVRMSKDELPPSNAFWSLTLYDLENGFFIPNDSKKYSVGENAGFKLNAEGGIEIYVSATKPKGVPIENWLPINRDNIDVNGQTRIYEPNSEKMKSWIPAKFEMLPSSK